LAKRFNSTQGQNREDYYGTYADVLGAVSRHTDGIQIGPDSYTSGIVWVFRGVFSDAVKGCQM